MFKKLINLFTATKKEVVPPIHGADDVNFVFNVDNFNEWFCDPNNDAVYANDGIFLRLDKFSECQIDDYLLKRFNLVRIDAFTKEMQLIIDYFYKDIRADWTKKIKRRILSNNLKTE